MALEVKQSQRQGKETKGEVLGCGNGRESRGVNGPRMMTMGLKVITKMSHISSGENRVTPVGEAEKLPRVCARNSCYS